MDELVGEHATAGEALVAVVVVARGDADPGPDVVGELLTFKESLEKLDREMIQEAARTYFNMENTIQVTLLPEEKK